MLKGMIKGDVIGKSPLAKRRVERVGLEIDR